MSFDVIGGDFPKGGGYFGAQSFSLPAGSWGKKQEVPISLLQSVELVSQETTHHKAHKVGKGLAGAAVLGPLGLVFGALAEGKTSTKVSFVVQLTDGRSFLATADNKTFLKIKAASVGSRKSDPLAFIENEPSYPMPGLQEARAAYAALSFEGDSVDHVPFTLQSVMDSFSKHGWSVTLDNDTDDIPSFFVTRDEVTAAVFIYHHHVDEASFPEELLARIKTYPSYNYTVVPSCTDKPFISVEDSIDSPSILLEYRYLDETLPELT